MQLRFILLAGIASCGAPQSSTATTTSTTSVKPDAQTVHHLDDPDLNHPIAAKLLAIDWSTVHLANDVDARALWQQIAPTPDDWQEKLAEVPVELQRRLGVALLREGNFACPIVPPACGKAPTFAPVKAELADPCFRRQLALWSFDQIEKDDRDQLRDAFKQIAALPPPESELTADLVRATTDMDQDFRMSLVAAMKRAHQDELANTAINLFDDKHLVEATQLHVDGAFQALAAATQRGVFLKAIGDVALKSDTRVQAMSELVGDDDKIGPDLATALVAATKTPDCRVAAAAAIMLSRHGNHRFIPTRGTYPSTMRGLCVLSEYELMMRGDESSPLSSYLPAHGLEYTRVIYDEYSDSDVDGDGDIHTERATQLIDRANASLPEVDILSKALMGCTKPTCETNDHVVRLTLRGTELDRIDIIDKPPC
ncbi:MAG: hypothetical protein QM831_18645 [Kofleriaceae bacterium]